MGSPKGSSYSIETAREVLSGAAAVQGVNDDRVARTCVVMISDRTREKVKREALARSRSVTT